MATSYDRGHKIKYNHGDNYWYFIDNGERVEGSNRPCKRCGELATEDGHDACLANLPGVMNACCGHGDGRGYIMFNDGRIFDVDIKDMHQGDAYKKTIKVPRLHHPLDPNPQQYDEVVINEETDEG